MAWNIDDFKLDDEINQQIWEQSPALQREVHAQTDDNGEPLFNGSYGCQQAMLGNEGFDENPLPWVPDLVGKDYGAKGSILIVGSAYAPFLIGYGGRQCIAPDAHRHLAHRRATGRFLDEHFFPLVVNNDGGNYYDKISNVLGHGEGQVPIISPRAIAVTDLCRGSFVYRPNGEAADDICGDRVISDAHPPIPAGAETQCRRMFDTYLRAENRYGWLNRRLNNGGLRVVIALGLIAENGILRRFHERGAQIRENESGSEYIPGNHNPRWNWVGRYAHAGFNLGYWLTAERWWNVSFGKHLELCVIPTYHPSAREWTPGYPENLRAKLAAMLARHL